MSRQRGESLQQYKARVRSEALTAKPAVKVAKAVVDETVVDNTPKAPAKAATPKVKKEDAAKAADSE